MAAGIGMLRKHVLGRMNFRIWGVRLFGDVHLSTCSLPSSTVRTSLRTRWSQARVRPASCLVSFQIILDVRTTLTPNASRSHLFLSPQPLSCLTSTAGNPRGQGNLNIAIQIANLATRLSTCITNPIASSRWHVRVDIVYRFAVNSRFAVTFKFNDQTSHPA